MRYLAPDYIYTPEGLREGQVVAVNEQGRIAWMKARDSLDVEVPAVEVEELSGMALLPGFVNAHSHVFQRVLRGHTHRPLSANDTFWTWRKAMYAEAARLTPDILYAQARQTYKEMLQAGYTTVGEFHYVHHQPDGRPYTEPNAMAEAIVAAGKEVGIRVVLLMTAYAQSGFRQPPEEGQRRFCDPTVEAYLARVEALRQRGDAVGLAPHSVRAVPESWFGPIAAYSREQGLPLHIHVDEQIAEIEQCLATYRCTPVELLERWGVLGSNVTVIHATHANAIEIDLLARYGCTVCVCPTTEGDLGDGIAPYAELLAARIPLAIGADSNTRLDPFEELRWAEYTARMRYQRRRVLVAGELDSPGPLLLEYGTRRGAKALGVSAGEIAPGQAADFVGMDLKHPALLGWSPQDLLDMLFFGASASVVRGVWVAGERVVK